MKSNLLFRKMMNRQEEIPIAESVPVSVEPRHRGNVYAIEVDRILPNPAQPRRTFHDDSILRLADSIHRHGIIQPLTVRRMSATDRVLGCLFELIAGERRLRAAKMLGMREVPCIVMEADAQQSAEFAMIENLQREDLSMFEQASAIAQLMETYSMTQEEIARQLSSSQSYVANKLRLLRLTVGERERILDAGLSERHARALLKISSPEERKRALEYIIAHGLNVARTEEYIDSLMFAQIPEKPEKKAPRKMIIKDIRIFYNTLDRAVELVKQAGIAVHTEKHDVGEHVEVRILIPKSKQAS